MRERARDKGRLEDIIEYSDRAMQFAQGKSFEDFTTDNLLYYAVMKNVEVVGEASKGEDLFNDTQDAVYKSIVGMAKNMRARGMSSEEIAEITGLSDLEIEEL